MYELKKIERYLRVNLVGPGPRLIKKNLPGRGLTEIKKHWPKAAKCMMRPASNTSPHCRYTVFHLL